MKGLGTLVLLTAVFLTMSGSAAPSNWLVAIGFGLVITALARREPGLRMGMPTRHPWRVVQLIAAALGLIARGTTRTFAVLVGLRSWRRVGLVAVPLLDRTQQQADVSGLITSASPGSVMVGIDRRRHEMVINMLDTSQSQEEIDRLQAFYDRYQRRLED